MLIIILQNERYSKEKYAPDIDECITLIYSTGYMSNREKADHLTIKIPADLMRRVEKIAMSMDLTSAAVIEMAVDRLVRAPDPRAAVTEILREPRNSKPGLDPAE
jgi:hypothetical protein